MPKNLKIHLLKRFKRTKTLKYPPKLMVNSKNISKDKPKAGPIEKIDYKDNHRKS